MDNNKIIVKQWLTKFKDEIEVIQIEFDSFFKDKKINNYITVQVDEEAGLIRIEIDDAETLPSHIIDRIKAAYLNSKPK